MPRRDLASIAVCRAVAEAAESSKPGVAGRLLEEARRLHGSSESPVIASAAADVLAASLGYIYAACREVMDLYACTKIVESYYECIMSAVERAVFERFIPSLEEELGSPLPARG